MLDDAYTPYDFDAYRLERIFVGQGVPARVTDKRKVGRATDYKLVLSLIGYGQIGPCLQEHIGIFMGAAECVNVWQDGERVEVRVR